jgi:inosose dehydratase
MTSTSRRDFLKAGAAVAAGVSFPPGLSADSQGSRKPLFGFGVASYSLRAFTLEQAIDMTKRLGIQRLTLKDMHLPLTSTDQEMQAALENIRAAGMELVSCGVVYMQTEEEVRHAFAYAKRAGLKYLVGAPDSPLLDLTEQLVKETDISLAIHNHGPTDKRYPSPESAYALIKNLDKRMGLCLDMSHTMRMGLDPAHEAERFFDRVLDVHIKDVTSADAQGKTVEIGRGVIDIPRFLATMMRLNYARTLHFEFEKDEKDPLPGMAESVGYVRGVLRTLEDQQ